MLASAALFEFDRASGLNIDDRTGCEGERRTGIERRPQVRLIPCSREKGTPQRGLPIAIIPDAAFVKGRDQVEDGVTPLPEPIEGMLQ